MSCIDTGPGPAVSYGQPYTNTAYFGHRDRAFRRIVTDAHVVVLRG